MTERDAAMLSVLGICFMLFVFAVLLAWMLVTGRVQP